MARYSDGPTIDSKTTAVVVVDMWDRYTCETFQGYVDELVERLNEALPRFREAQIPVLWMADEVYRAHLHDPQYQALLKYSPYTPRVPWAAKKHLRPPGDNIWWNDCLCEDEHCTKNYVWTRLHPRLDIAEQDYIGWGRMMWGFLIKRNIFTLLYAGVTLNVCVLDTRNFSVCQSLGGKRKVFVMGDLTEPFIPGCTQDEARDKLYPYYRKYICPVVNSSEVEFK